MCCNSEKHSMRILLYRYIFLNKFSFKFLPISFSFIQCSDLRSHKETLNEDFLRKSRYLLCIVYIFVVCIIREYGMKKTRFLSVEYVILLFIHLWEGKIIHHSEKRMDDVSRALKYRTSYGLTSNKIVYFKKRS
jgi:uncharacterized membrane protein YozB (DUF420 family)